MVVGEEFCFDEVEEADQPEGLSADTIANSIVEVGVHSF